MSKKKKIIIAVAILSCIILAFIGGQSFSKYVSEIRGEGTAEIATWDFKVNGGSEQIQAINLISTYNNETLIDNKIAPGTEGSFNISIDGTGTDVGIDYHIKFEEGGTKPTNLKFIYDDYEYNSISELEDKLSGRINANDENKSKQFTIKWKWLYETGQNDEEKARNNTQDTEDAKKLSQYSFNVIVSGTQVAPQHT